MLNWRSKTLSSYAGDTALPGGKIDDDDKTIEDTAVRPDIMSFSCDLIVTGLPLRDGKHTKRSCFTLHCACCLR
jgi:peroxisomal coenzyme A diphosphatase NUDT7